MQEILICCGCAGVSYLLVNDVNQISPALFSCFNELGDNTRPANYTGLITSPRNLYITKFVYFFGICTIKHFELDPNNIGSGYVLPDSFYLNIIVLHLCERGILLFDCWLQLEHQMAEESIDSGISSEHSQHQQQPEHRKANNQEIEWAYPTHILAQKPPLQLCEGYYGPSLPNSFISSCIYTDSNRAHRPNTSHPPELIDQQKLFTDTLKNSTDCGKQDNLLFDYISQDRSDRQRIKEIHQTDCYKRSNNTMSSNYIDHTNDQLAPQGQTQNVGPPGVRSTNPRVHFAHDQQPDEQSPVLQRGLLGNHQTDRPARISARSTRATDPNIPRPPLLRNYSTRDYAYLPPLQQTTSAASSTTQSLHVRTGENPVSTTTLLNRLSESMTSGRPEASTSYPLAVDVENVHSPTTHTFPARELQCVNIPPQGQQNVGPVLGDSTRAGIEQQRQLLSALLNVAAAAKAYTQTPAVTQPLAQTPQIPLLPVGAQKPIPQVNPPRRENLSARWSDSDMRTYDVQRYQQLQQQQQKLRQQQRQQQQAAAAAAAAAAAVAIAAMQGSSKSLLSANPLQTARSSTSGQMSKTLSTRSCYSSGDEDPSSTNALLASFAGQMPLYGLSNNAGAKTQVQSTGQLSSTYPAANPSNGSTVAQQVMNQLAKMQNLSLSAEDYANYQSLEAILGHNGQPIPPPAPPVESSQIADMYQAKSTLPEESHSVYSSHSTSTIQNINPQSATLTRTAQLSGAYGSQPDPLSASTFRQRNEISAQLGPSDDRFGDFTALQSERCLAAPQPSGSGGFQQPAFGWSNPSTENQFKTLSQRITSSLNGLLAVHLVAGNGLSSSQILLRDLYCVIETDSIRKARSMIRTSTNYFEWNEVFELDMEDNRFLAFLLYQWDPRTRHRLCFYGGIDLRSLVLRLISNQKKETPQSQGSVLLSPAISVLSNVFDKIALQLEPRGVLYLEFAYYALDRIFHRHQPNFALSLQHSPPSNNVLFGVKIDELVERERAVAQLMESRFPERHRQYAEAPYIPLFIRKCIEEIDRRGTEVVGIYRLAGSVWMKLQIRELFNRVTKSTLRAVFQGDHEAMEAIAGSIDLSPERVPDIHAITALFKDFLRELPEPLFTSALYPMFYDAMQVTLPGFSQNGAKLMLNILDCLPTNNQEILLYLLDHFKRITNNGEVNKMNTHNLATCLGPVLFYPAPSSARGLDPAILEPRKMAEIFRFILEIWPDERTSYPQSSPLETWAPTYASSPTLDEEKQRHQQIMEYPTQMPHKRKTTFHRASSVARSTLSGPPAPGVGEQSPRFGHRSLSMAAKSASDRTGYVGIGRTGRVKYNSTSGGTLTRFGPLPESRSRHELDAIQRIGLDRVQPRGLHSPRHKPEADSRQAQEYETDPYILQTAEPSRRLRQRFSDVQASASTGTDSGTRSSVSVGGRAAAPDFRQVVLPKRGPRPESSRSFSQERAVYSHSPRPSHRTHPFS